MAMAVTTGTTETTAEVLSIHCHEIEIPPLPHSTTGSRGETSDRVSFSPRAILLVSMLAMATTTPDERGNTASTRDTTFSSSSSHCDIVRIQILIETQRGSMLCYSTTQTAEQIRNELRVETTPVEDPIHYVSKRLCDRTLTEGTKINYNDKNSNSDRTQTVPITRDNSLLPTPVHSTKIEWDRNHSTPSKDSSPPTILIHLVERLPSGLVKKQWTACLQQQQQQHSPDQGVRDDDKERFTFWGLCRLLIGQINQIQQQRDNYQGQLQSVMQARDEWKQTAQSLEHEWEKEKSDLLGSFLVLYKEKDEQQQRAQARIQELEQLIREKEEIITVLQQTPDPKTTKRTTGMISNKLPDYLEQLPKDQDDELYDAQTVARLAEGPSRARRGSKKPNRMGNQQQTLTTMNDPHEQISVCKHLPAKRRNQLTGAIEYYDTDALLEDPALFPIQEELEPPPKKSMTKERASSTTGRKTVPTKKISTKRTVGCDVQTDNDDDDNGEEKDDDHFVDKDLQSDILKQLEALREAEGG